MGACAKGFNIEKKKIQEGMTSQENDPYEEPGSTFAEDCN